MHFGFAFRTSALPAVSAAIFSVCDFTLTHLLLVLTASGNLRWNRSSFAGYSMSVSGTNLGTGSAVLAVDTWYWISGTATIDNAAGEATVAVDDVVDLNLTSQDTQNGGTAVCVAIGLGSIGNLIDTDFDDLIINDANGSANNTRPTDSRVDCHLPNANGNSAAWTRSTGSDQYATIDEVGINADTDYNATTTLNALDTVGVEDFKNPGFDIRAVQVSLVARKVDSGTCAVAPVIRINSTDNVGTLQSPGISYVSLRQNYDTQPDASDWNEADFNAGEFGYSKVL